MKSKEKLIIVGNGMVGMRTLEKVLEMDPDRYQITVFGEESYYSYNRIHLSYVLSGEKEIDDIITHDEQWFKERGINLYLGQHISKIDSKNRLVITGKGDIHNYDHLCLATGSTPINLPLPGTKLLGVISFRDIHHVHTIMKLTQHKNKVVVIGGGTLGLEAAFGLQMRGMDVTVIHLEETLMEHHLDQFGGKLLQDKMEDMGLKFFVSSMTKEILGDQNNQYVRAVRLADGKEIQADLVVIAVGVRPRIELGASANLEVDQGIVVDNYMTTSDINISAVGECVQVQGQCFGLVAPGYEMANICALKLTSLGDEDAIKKAFSAPLLTTRLKVMGIDLFSVGQITNDKNSEEIVFHDEKSGAYKKLIIKDNRLRGAILVGDVTNASWYLQHLKEKKKLPEDRKIFILGHEAVASSCCNKVPTKFTDDAEICGCNGIKYKKIKDSVIEKNLTCIEDVKIETKAATSCGGCTSNVQQIINDLLGKDIDEDEINKSLPLCPCTDHTHKDIKEFIKEKKIFSMKELMVALNFSESVPGQGPDGCPICRPALNYYLLATFPFEYEDDSSSRLVNERLHANIQKDGTYSVVPRLWGGIVNPNELRTIADIADKYNVPTIKITGGQRIDLFGIKKENLAEMWEEFNNAGMISGYAYAKGLRTVKTCIGSSWCRFGTQDSVHLGVELEKLCWGAWAPHKVKMGVSACPRNCAEATIKDIGIITTKSGIEISVGGNGGNKVRVSEGLCKVNSSEDAKEHIVAFFELYRQDAFYKERTAGWIERVGIDYVKKQVVEDTVNRKKLYQEFMASQEIFQKDPWSKQDGSE